MKPTNCRNRLRDEGKLYPKSGCQNCNNGGLTGCPYENNENETTKISDELMEDAWRNEFESLIDGPHDREKDTGHYVNYHHETIWLGFKLSKKNQPIVELPKRGIGYYHDDMVNLDDVIESLTAVGIQYKVKQ